MFSNIGSVTSIVRSFRIGRLLRLVKRARSLRLIFNTLLISLPGLANIGALIFLLLFIFSILGTTLFAFNKPYLGITEKANFRSFFDSFFTLIRISTGESWHILLADGLRQQQPDHVCFDVSNYEDFQKNGK